MKEIKHAVQAVIFNSIGEVLAVSRKDDHEDFGLPGGKVDPEDLDNGLEWKLSTLEAAMKRELKEETGLECNMNTAEVVFSTHRDGYMGHTYLITDWEGEFDYDEPHVVKWAPFDTVIGGSFGLWNRRVYESLTSMGVEFMLHREPEIKNEYVFSLMEDDYGDGGYLFFISPKYDKEGDSKWAYYDREDEAMEDEISHVLSKVKADIDFLDEASMKLYKRGEIEYEFTEEEVVKLLTDAGIPRDKFSLTIE